jgi:hypothetical protein
MLMGSSHIVHIEIHLHIIDYEIIRRDKMLRYLPSV